MDKRLAKAIRGLAAVIFEQPAHFSVESPEGGSLKLGGVAALLMSVMEIKA